MLKRFLPQQKGFFELFQKSVDILVLAATQFHIMLLDLTTQQQSVGAISAFEKEADKVAYQTFQLLHKTFITPFDRNDIHQLASQLDDILDLINACARRFPFYELNSVPTQMIEMAEISVQCTKLLKKAIYQLHSLKQSSDILHACDEIDILENKGQAILLTGEKQLFNEEEDFKQFFKLNEIYKRMKGVMDRCQDVANIVRGIVLEYS